jgi:Glycosyl transferase family 2
VIELILAGSAFVLAVGPCLLFLRNLALYRTPTTPATVADTLPRVSVLIPARNEERSITLAVETALQSRRVEIEVIVLDDHSSDRTAEFVAEIASKDRRVKLVSSPPLPEGWCGKQHACWVLRGHSGHELLLFLDADVRVAEDGIARLVSFLHASGADLVSAVPRQETETFLERLVLPLIHFVLLAFLPMGRMRRSRRPGYAAGCGQVFLARREAYDAMGGHSAVKTTLHDGLRLPRAFRCAGLMTDLCDGTELASCRMYRGAAEVWRGLAKNATEGLGAPALIGPATVLLAGGQILPVVLVATGAWSAMGTAGWVLAGSALMASYLPRIVGVFRFRQSWLGALLHPLGVGVLLTIQWYALGCALVGRPPTWKGRAYGAAGRAGSDSDRNFSTR